MIDLNHFIQELSSDSPAPGGGSASAITGMVAASLSSMVASLSIKKKGYEERKGEFESIIDECMSLMEQFSELAELDTQAFNGIMEARRLPKGTDQEKKIRDITIDKATKNAISTPWKVAYACRKVLSISFRLIDIGIPGAITDAGASMKIAAAALESSLYNVSINLKYIKDVNYVENERIKLKLFMEDVQSLESLGEKKIRDSIGKEFMW